MAFDLVSIITPTYNSSRFIERTIKSIQDQTFKNWELLITDDCSTDNTINIIQNFIKNDDRIRLFQLRKNAGAGIARNNSIREAKGRYIAFCDSDDQWLPDKLEIQLKHLSNTKTSFVYSSYLTQNENQNIIGQVICPYKISYTQILRNNYLGCLTVMYDSNVLGKMFMPNIRKRQDWVLWINIIRKLEVVYGVLEPLAIYTIREDSISKNKLSLLKYNWSVYNDTLNFNRFKSTLYMIQFLYFYAKKKINE